MPQVGDAKGEFRGTTYRDDAALTAWLAKRPTEAALEPDLPIIDPHHHFWDTPQRGHYLLPELLADIGGGHNVVSTVFLECRAMYRKSGPPRDGGPGRGRVRQRHRGDERLGQLWPLPSRRGYRWWRRPQRRRRACGRCWKPRWPPQADVFAALRHGVAWDGSEAVGKFASRVVPPHLVLDAKFREGFAQLAPLGLSFESWQYHPQLPDAIDLARAFPDTTIILNHVGGVLGVGPYSGHRQEILAGWRKDIYELAKCPNVYCKLGGIGMVSFGFDFHERDIPPSSDDLAAAWRQYIEPCIEAFGVNRCMFESNFPPDKQSCGYTELWNAFKRITANASASEKTALYSGTAARVYRLTVPEPV